MGLQEMLKNPKYLLIFIPYFEKVANFIKNQQTTVQYSKNIRQRKMQ